MSKNLFVIVDFPFLHGQLAIVKVEGVENFLVWLGDAVSHYNYGGLRQSYREGSLVINVDFYHVDISEQWKDRTFRQVEEELVRAIKGACDKLGVSKLTKYIGRCPEIPGVEVKAEKSRQFGEDDTMLFDLDDELHADPGLTA